jgi:NTE family protein
LDGGLTNNVPIDMLIKRGYKNIIVVRIFGPGIEKKVKIPEDVKVIYIAPKINLCNVLEFDKKKAVRNITLGYYDAVRMLKPLVGKDYYIESTRTEMDYLNSLLSPEEDLVMKLGLMNKNNLNQLGAYYRKLVEGLYPQLANILKLDKEWRYEELYYALLEYCAKKLRIKKYRIYTETEFCEVIRQNIEKVVDEPENKDDIMDLVLTIIRNYLS